jgi:N-acetylglucosaminyl-diphospho-decaprenol L-rhamnosyltransferase
MVFARPRHYAPVLTVSNSTTVAVIIVTYDSGHVLGLCLEALQAQTRRPDLVVVVDSNSPNPAYLDSVPREQSFRVVRMSRNEGFCGGNNTGYALARGCEYVLFLNPDAFLSTRFIEEALAWMEQPGNADVGCLTGTLLGFDVEAQRPTGRIDSTGVFQHWYGKWYDRGKGSFRDTGATTLTGETEEIPAACGALMFCRTRALEQVALRAHEVFDSRFFMYKEDIDLSLRLRARGWRIVLQPQLLCHHGRGWQGRASASPRAKYLSARNELRVCWRHRWATLPYSLAKYLYVALLERALLHVARKLRKPA